MNTRRGDTCGKNRNKRNDRFRPGKEKQMIEMRKMTGEEEEIITKKIME